jgi:Tfp pilus assembly protein PilE
MHKPLVLALLLFLTATGFACQSYTRALEQSVQRADETAAIGALRTLSVAQRTYSVSNEGKFATFEQLVQGGFLDSRFNSEKPKFKGYVLTMTVKNGTAAEGSFTVNADPEPPQQGRHFFMDSSSALIHTNGGQTASESDPTLDQ